MKLTASAESAIRCSRETTFQYLTDAATYSHIMLPLFPLAGIRSSSLIDADVPATGVRRRVVLTDGTEIVETIDEYSPPRIHRYSWGNGLKVPLSLLVSHAAAVWKFTKTNEGTFVRWSYDFTLTSPLIWPLGLPVFMRFQTWMRQSLERARTQLESN